MTTEVQKVINQFKADTNKFEKHISRFDMLRILIAINQDISGVDEQPASHKK